MRSFLVLALLLASQPASAGPEYNPPKDVCEADGSLCEIDCINDPLDGNSACDGSNIHVDNALEGGYVILKCEGKDACNSVHFSCTDPTKCFVYCSKEGGFTPSCNSVTVQPGVTVVCKPGACNSVEGTDGAIVLPPGCLEEEYQSSPYIDGIPWPVPICLVLCFGESTCNSANFRVRNQNAGIDQGQYEVYSKLICLGKDSCNSVKFRCENNEYCSAWCARGNPACNSLTTPKRNGERMPVYCVPDIDTACNSVKGGQLIEFSLSP